MKAALGKLGRRRQGVAEPADFEQLRAAFSPKAGSEAEWLIDQLAPSHPIFTPDVIKPRPAPGNEVAYIVKARGTFS